MQYSKTLEHHGYHGIDEQTKVRYFLEGIKYEPLSSCINTILASDELRSNFTKAKDLCKNFLANKTTGKERNITIASLKSGKDKDKIRGEIKPDVTVKDQHHKYSEYQALSPAQKLGLKVKRSERSDKNDGKIKHRKLDEWIKKSVIKALESVVSEDKAQTQPLHLGAALCCPVL